MIDAKRAVTLAVEWFDECEYADRSYLRFEGVELVRNEGNAHWLVTLSEPAPGTFNLAALVRARARNYLVVQIDAESETVESVKSRKP